MTRPGLDVAELKRHANGRWNEILPALAGIPAEALDGQHHECPKCGGKDRFRALNDFSTTGAVLCNHCFSQANGDGLSAIRHYAAVDFRSALRLLADYLGTNGSAHRKTDGNGQAKANAKKPATEAGLIKNLEPIAEADHAALFAMYAKAKRPISAEGISKCNGKAAMWHGYRCLVFHAHTPIDNPKATAIVLLQADGADFPKCGKLRPHKTHTVGGSTNAWLACGDVASATTILDVEGVTDLLAAASVGLPDGWAAVTSIGGAKARGKLPRPWAAGKHIIATGDADKAGVEGQHKAAAAYHNAGADVVLGQLPYPVTDDHGEDLRNYLIEGHTVTDLPTVAVTAGDAAAWSKRKASSPLSRAHEQLSNFQLVGSNGKADAVPRPMSDIIALVLQQTAGELRRVEKNLFAHAAGQPVSWLNSAAALLGYLQSRCGIVNWRKGTGFVTKEEFHCELQRQAPAFTAIETMPHWPPVLGHYYACGFPTPGDGRALAELISRHCFESELDREIALAMYATGAWGGSAGMRPAFLITAPTGRGKGKSIFAQHFARVYGGTIDVVPNEAISTIKQRLLSPKGAEKRIATLDNLKATHFSCAELESLITADVINGKQMYVGDANRPNLITWTITLNGASLSTDMAQRVVEIRLREPSYSETWAEGVALFIDANRERIIADAIGFLQRPTTPMRRYSRFGTWEAGVLSHVEHPDDCLDLILERRGAVDVEQEEGEIVEDYFAHKLAWMGYDTDRDDIFIPNDLTAKWFNAATGDTKKVTGVTRTLKQLHDEGRVCHLLVCRNSDRTARGFRWVGERADAADVTHYDIRERLAAKAREQREPNSGAEQAW
jgi:phage/plasmid primase-like uncharacterized protein